MRCGGREEERGWMMGEEWKKPVMNDAARKEKLESAPWGAVATFVGAWEAQRMLSRMGRAI